MGWTGYTNDRRKAVDIVREELVGYSDRYKVIAHSGAKYWVLENTEDNKRHAVIVITKRHNGDLYTKVVDESMGPFSYDFPERFLDLLSDTDNEFAVEWREKVREYHAAKKASPKLAKGDTVVFAKPIEFVGNFSLDRMTYLGGYRFRGDLGGRGVNVTLPKTWRTSYDWKVEALPDVKTFVGEYLRQNDYATVEEWATDSGYVYDKCANQWADDNGAVVDPYVQIQIAIESSLAKSA